MLAQTSLLLQRPMDAPVAWLTEAMTNKLCQVANRPRQVTGWQFLNDVNKVSKQLPCDCRYAINLCDNRYLFLVSLCAVIVRQHCNLLPPNKNLLTQEKLFNEYEGSYILHDGCVEIAPNIASVDLNDIDWSEQLNKDDINNVEIALNHIALISFTSGSTGESKANLKTWRTLHKSSLINAQHMLRNQEQTFYHLATVPGQHMWGLETSVIMALFANVCLVDNRPLFPHDILQTLANMPEPRILISTPLHLRALSLNASDQQHTLPSLEQVLTATAPIDQVLSEKIEEQFSTTVKEVYGCSEVGSMASREPSKTEVWTHFEGLDFQQMDERRVTVSTDYLPEPILLDDHVTLMPNRKFTLDGRNSDQIKIAGKRGSLYEVNRVLNSFDGLVDGVVIFPQQNRLVPRLVALVVLTGQADKKALQAHFRQNLDAAFVPRPILLVDKLPRQENGKLDKSALLGFYQQLIKCG